MAMDCDCICSALGTYEFSYYLSSDDVAHIITQLNHFWLYIQPWHMLYPAAAVYCSRLQVMKMDSVAMGKKQFEVVYALEA